MPVGAAGPFASAGPAGAFSPAGPAEAPAPATAIVVVSHSRRLAEGVAEIASQMAPGVVVRGVGGLGDGLGTDAWAVRGAVTDLLDAGHEVLLTADLGSALMVAEIVVEEEVRPVAGRCALTVDCPVVRGTLAAAVTARAGGDAASCARAAARTAADWPAGPAAADWPVADWPAPGGGGRGAHSGRGAGNGPDAADAAGPAAEPDAADTTDPAGAGERAPSARRSVLLADPAGLHARPAAALAALLDDERAHMRVGTSPATTLQEILALGLHGRARLEVTVTGPHAERTLERIERLLGGVV